MGLAEVERLVILAKHRHGAGLTVSQNPAPMVDWSLNVENRDLQHQQHQKAAG
jgi:hypothetical protein